MRVNDIQQGVMLSIKVIISWILITMFRITLSKILKWDCGKGRRTLLKLYSNDRKQINNLFLIWIVKKKYIKHRKISICSNFAKKIFK